MSFDVTGRGVYEKLYAAPTAAPTAKVGDVMEDECGGRWRYCKAGAAVTNPLEPVGCYSQPDDCTPGVTAVGSFTIAVTGITPNTSVTADQYANGTIIIGAAAANRRFYQIRSNTVSATTTTTLTLYSPVLYAIAGTEWATIVPSPWSDVRPFTSGTSGFMSAVGMPLQAVTSGYYFWAKTRGPVFGIVSSTIPGAAASDRYVVFQAGDGALIMADEAWNGVLSNQAGGWLIPRTGGTYGGGDQTFWLQIE